MQIHRVSILVTEEHIEKFAYFSSLTLILSEPPQVMQMLHILFLWLSLCVHCTYKPAGIDSL